MTLGRLTFRHENGLSYNARGPFHPRAGHAAVLVDDVMYVFGGCTIYGTNLGDLTALNLSSKWFGTFTLMLSFK